MWIVHTYGCLEDDGSERLIISVHSSNPREEIYS